MFETNKKAWSAEELGMLESLEGTRRLVRLGRSYAAITAKRGELGIKVGSGNIANYYQVHLELAKVSTEFKGILDVVLYLLKQFNRSSNTYMKKAYYQYYVDLVLLNVDAAFPSYSAFNAKEELQFYAFGGKKIINPHHESLATLSWLEQPKVEPVREEVIEETPAPVKAEVQEEKVVIPPKLSSLPAQPVIIIVGNLKITIEQQ